MTPPDAQGPAAAREVNLFNALEQIRRIASLHYLGGAFDPEHMRTLANIAADALNGRDIPPVAEPSDETREACIAMAEEYAKWVD